MKYESEILYDLMKRDGLLNPSQDNLPYESELKEKYVDEVKGAYPKVTDYRPEWLNYNIGHYIPADFPTESLVNVTSGTVNNVVPYAYKSAILKGSTKYRDIDTGEFLETFEEGRNLELVSVKMPVLTTVGKNLLSPQLLNSVITESKQNYSGVNFNFNPSDGSFTVTGTFTSFDVTLLCDVTKFMAILEHGKHYYTSDKMMFEVVSRDGTTQWTNNIIYDKNKHIKVTPYYQWYNVEGTTINETYYPQIEIGNITSYEPYKTNILTVNEDVTLRGIGDVKDELNLLTGEVKERIEEIVLDGGDDEEWNRITDGSGTHQRFVLKRGNRIKPISNVNENKFLCDKFKTVKNITGENSQEMCLMEWLDEWYLSIVIDKTKLNSVDVDGFRLWLQSNPVKFNYVIETATIKTFDLNNVNQDGVETTFRPFEGTMHIKTDGTPLKPLFNGEIPVEATTQNLASFVNLEGVERTVNEYIEEELTGDDNDEQLL